MVIDLANSVGRAPAFTSASRRADSATNSGELVVMEILEMDNLAKKGGAP